MRNEPSPASAGLNRPPVSRAICRAWFATAMALAVAVQFGGCGKGNSSYTVLDNSVGPDNCDENASWKDVDGEKACVCGTGYEGDGTTCVDIDGCAGAPCFEGVSCTDVAAPGTGFTCGPCPDGYGGDGVDCTELTDCSMDPGICDTNATCTDVNGEMRCVCDAGFVGNGTGCADVLECATDNGGCDLLTVCNEVIGGAPTCGDCPAPYWTGNGSDVGGCVDVLECATDNGGCDPLTACNEVAGGPPICGDCPAPYWTGNGGDVGGCADTLECATDNGGCDPLTACNEVVDGLPTCGDCPAPYWTGNGADVGGCTDVLECASGNGGCDPLTACNEVAGGLPTCGNCPAPYWTGNGADVGGCADIDECNLGTDNCDTYAPCANLPGGFTCEPCASGFEDVNGDGTLCVDWDECAGENGGHTCPAGSTCTNTIGGFDCSCPNPSESTYYDIDGNGVSDCLETMTTNSQFVDDASGWNLTYNASYNLSRIRLEPTNDIAAAATHCMVADPNTDYRAWAQIRYAGSYDGCFFNLYLEAYDTPDCSGSPTANGNIGTFIGSTWWTLGLANDMVSTENTASVKFTARAWTNYVRASAILDNVLVRSN